MQAAPAGRDGERGPWSYRDQTGSISTSSGTVSTTAYTSSSSHLSWISMEAAMHLEEIVEDTEFFQPPAAAKKSRKETSNQKKMEHIKILAKEFFHGPSAKRSIEGTDMSVLERWFTELGVGWVLHLADGAPAGKLHQTLDVSSWIRALTEIMDPFLSSMTALFAGDGSVEEQDKQAQYATFTQQALLKLLAFLDFTDAPLSLTCEVFVAPAPYQKVHALLRVRDTLSKTLSDITDTKCLVSFCSSPSAVLSAEVERILCEIDSVLSADNCKVGEAIRTEVEKIWTRILASMEDANDSSHTQTTRGLSGIHKVTESVMTYVRFLLGKSVGSVVSDAASRRKYLAADMLISIVQEKLASKSKALFPDQSLRFLFLLNNSSYMRDRVHHYIPKSHEEALAGKVDAYMESYIHTSWAPVLALLFNPKPLRLFGKNYSKLPKFESEFQKTYNTQKLWKVPDPKLRKTLREAIIVKIVPSYTKYIEDNKVVATPKFTPQNLEEMLQELFEG